MKQGFQSIMIRFVMSECFTDGLVGRKVISPTQVAKRESISSVDQSNHQSKKTVKVTSGFNSLEGFQRDGTGGPRAASAILAWYENHIFINHTLSWWSHGQATGVHVTKEHLTIS